MLSQESLLLTILTIMGIYSKHLAPILFFSLKKESRNSHCFDIKQDCLTVLVAKAKDWTGEKRK